MAYSTGSRINTNIAAFNALNALNSVNREMGMHQLRLASGKRVNSAQDDPSGYVISKKMEGRIRALGAAVDNVGDAQSVLSVAEGAYQTVADILTQVKEKQTRAANGAFGADEKTAIANEINKLMSEIDDVNDQTKFNGTVLFKKTGADTAYSQSFQVGEGSTDTLTVGFSATTGATALLGVAAGAVTSANISTLTADTALNTVNTEIGSIGGQLNRLSTKESNLNTAITNTEAAKSRILDADIAKEQISAVKLQILQQTATAQLAQANSSPQVFLSLFR
ncbi:MAG: flagellin [Ignavibacteriales bacterium]|nr:flagellin [Ignavibacteriales bacterium]